MTDVSPVLPPSDTPDALSTNVVVVDVPITAPTVVATASAISAPLILGSFPFFVEHVLLLQILRSSVPIVSNRVYEQECKQDDYKVQSRRFRLKSSLQKIGDRLGMDNPLTEIRQAG